MDLTFSPEQEALTRTVRAACARFDDDYWLEHDATAEFPHDFHRAMADIGVLGIAMPEAYGGTGLGVTEAALVMHEVARSSGGQSAASAIQLDALRNEFHRLWSSPSPEQAAPADATAVAGIVEDEADRLAALTLNELLAS